MDLNRGLGHTKTAILDSGNFELGLLDLILSTGYLVDPCVRKILDGPCSGLPLVEHCILDVLLRCLDVVDVQIRDIHRPLRPGGITL